jgi:hypothetical protein
MTRAKPAGRMSSLPEVTWGEFSSHRIRLAIERMQERQSRSGAEISTFRFGPLVLGIRIQRGGLTSLPEMIGHRAVSDARATALLDIIDGPEPILEALLPPDYHGPDRFVMSSATAYCLWEPNYGGKLTAVDRTNRRGVVWYRSATHLPSWEVARPFLQAFKGLAPTTGLTPVHAAAVALGERGILITGYSGAGKTSTALACVEAGWRYVGDDVVLIAGAPLRAINMYRSARVREDMMPHLRRSMTGMLMFSTDSGERKAELDVGRLQSSAIGDADIGAIVVPRRMGASGVTIAPMRRSTALRELSANTLVALPGDAAASYEAIAGAMADTPCYSLDPGPVLGLVPAALERLAAAW